MGKGARTMAQGLRRENMALPVIVPVANHNWNDLIHVEKFGNNPKVDTNTDPEDVWNQGGTYTFLTSSAVLYASSSDGSDTVDINVQGLDADWAVQEQSVTLTGTSQTAISGSWLRVFRAFNEDGTDLAGDVYIAETDDTTAGVPDTATKIKAKIDLADQQTLMAIYTVPDGYTAYMTRWYVAMAQSKSSYAIIKLQSRANSGVFRTRRRTGIEAGSTDYQEHLNPAIPFAAQTDLKIVVDTVGANDIDISGGFDLILLGDT
jgi:hypothetical protein